MGTRIIKDLVYGYIEINDAIVEIIRHQSFQRLKGISQLTARHLFPSANHTRFEHSLGVFHLARKFFFNYQTMKFLLQLLIPKRNIILKIYPLQHCFMILVTGRILI